MITCQRGLLVIMLFTCILAACGNSEHKKDEQGSSTSSEGTLTIEQARVEYCAGGEKDWAPAAGVQTVKSADSIRTDVTGHARLTFFTGTEVEILPGSELVVTNFVESAGGEYTITLDQLSGETLHRVARIADRADRYEVQTPSANLVVRGTVFGVQVAPDGATHVEVQDGVVEAQVAGQTYEINAGEALDVLADQTVPSTPYPIPTIPPSAERQRMRQTPSPIITPTTLLLPDVPPTASSRSK